MTADPTDRKQTPLSHTPPMQGQELVEQAGGIIDLDSLQTQLQTVSRLHAGGSDNIHGRISAQFGTALQEQLSTALSAQIR